MKQIESREKKEEKTKQRKSGNVKRNGRERREEEREERRKLEVLQKEERKKETGTMGRKKIQITRIMDERNRQVSPGGMGGWMSMRMGEKRVEEGGRRNTLHPI